MASSADLETRFAVFERDYGYREVACGGRLWRYRVGGRKGGPPVLVLVGATMVPDPLFLVICHLGSNHRVIAPAYPPAPRMDDLVDGVIAVLDAEQVATAHVVGSSFGGYLAQCLATAHPERVDRLVLAQTGVRHFVGAAAVTALRRLLQAAPTAAVKRIMWRTWQALLVDLGGDSPFWSALLRDILNRQLTKAHLVAVMAAIADFTAHHRPEPGGPAAGRPTLVLAAEHDRAFAAQADDLRAAYPQATFTTLTGAGHAAVFTHTDAYISAIERFLEPTAGPGRDNGPGGA